MSSNYFACDVCGTIDSIHATEQTGGGFKCSQCQHGHWHGHFEKRQYNPDVDLVLNRPNVHSDHPDLGEPSFS